MSKNSLLFAVRSSPAEVGIDNEERSTVIYLTNSTENRNDYRRGTNLETATASIVTCMDATLIPDCVNALNKMVYEVGCTEK
jgi:hypothetical protein